jgi:MFS family permease
MDKWGRKGGVIYCASLSIFGGVMLCASQNIGMFIAFRFFAGAGSWGFLALSKFCPTFVVIADTLSTCLLRRTCAS